MIELPSSELGRTFETVGWFHSSADTVADWLTGRWGLARRKCATDFNGLEALLEKSPILRRRVLLPAGDWTAMLTDGPLGTDLGGLPSVFAREFGLTAVRAVCSPDGLGRSGARIFAAFGVSGASSERHVFVAKDGGKWKFGQFGVPFTFEDTIAYGDVIVPNRLTESSVHRYLKALGIPLAADIQLDDLIAVEAP